MTNPMNGNEVVALACKTYVEQFAEFVGFQAKRFPQGAPEAPTQRMTETHLFGGHFRVDFLAGQANAVELSPDKILSFDPLDGSAGAMRVRMEGLSWDDVEFAHGLTTDLSAKLKPWFDHWYDPEDARSKASPGQPVGVIHWLSIVPGRLNVDFGTAPPDAFWALVALLRDAGATSLTVRDTRSHTPGGQGARPTPSTG